MTVFPETGSSNLQRLGGLRPVHAIPEMPRTQNNIDSEENRTIGETWYSQTINDMVSPSFCLSSTTRQRYDTIVRQIQTASCNTVHATAMFVAK